MTTLPTPAQLVALGMSEIEAHAVVSALVLLEHVPAEKLIEARSVADDIAWHSERDEDRERRKLLGMLYALRRLLPERPVARRQDDSATPATRRQP